MQFDLDNVSVETGLEVCHPRFDCGHNVLTLPFLCGVGLRPGRTTVQVGSGVGEVNSVLQDFRMGTAQAEGECMVRRRIASEK